MMHTVDEPVTTNRCDHILVAVQEHAQLEREQRTERY